MRIGIGNTIPERSNLPGQSGGISTPNEFIFEVNAVAGNTIDLKTKNNYGLPGIPFKQYSDVGNLDNISDDKYNSIKNDIRNFNKNNLDKNKKIFNSLLN